MNTVSRWAQLPLIFAIPVVLAACGANETPGSRYETPGAQEAPDPAKAAHFHALANYAIDAGDWEVAEKLLKDALTADIGHGPSHNNLGKVYLEQGRLYLAAWEFEYASKLMPFRPEPRNNLGLVLESVRKFDEAAKHYEAARQLAPDHPELIGNLARTRLRRGDDPEQLRELFQQLIMKDQRPEWREWAATQLARIGD